MAFDRLRWGRPQTQLEPGGAAAEVRQLRRLIQTALVIVVIVVGFLWFRHGQQQDTKRANCIAAQIAAGNSQVVADASC